MGIPLCRTHVQHRIQTSGMLDDLQFVAWARARADRARAHQGIIGRIRYDFVNIKDYEEFSSTIPLSTYESIASQIERCRNGTQNIFWPSPIKWFAKSSGRAKW